jgi:hypothetical protein
MKHCDHNCMLCDSGAVPARGWQILLLLVTLAGWAALVGELLRLWRGGLN